ncbi:MAG: hypothetical protein IJV33_08755 [Bacteroidaceae bacterium]|nr:hypothetical protein [Bacteroidaceae bacterium]
MDLMLLGMTTEVIWLQEKNARYPIDTTEYVISECVTEFGIVTVPAVVDAIEVELLPTCTVLLSSLMILNVMETPSDVLAVKVSPSAALACKKKNKPKRKSNKDLGFMRLFYDLRQSPTKAFLYTYKKRGTVCPHLQAEGRRKYPK